MKPPFAYPLLLAAAIAVTAVGCTGTGAKSPESEPPPQPPETPKVAADCKLNEHNIPCKVVIAARGMRAAAEPGGKADGTEVKFYHPYYVFDFHPTPDAPTHVRVGTTTRRESVVGWVPVGKTAAERWDTRVGVVYASQIPLLVYADKQSAAELAATGRTSAEPISRAAPQSPAPWMPWPVAEEAEVNVGGQSVRVLKILFLAELPIGANLADRPSDVPGGNPNRLPEAQIAAIRAGVRKLDCVLVVDNTASTGPFLAGIKDAVKGIAAQLASTAGEGCDIAFSVVLYRDYVDGLYFEANGEKSVTRTFPLTTDHAVYAFHEAGVDDVETCGVGIEPRDPNDAALRLTDAKRAELTGRLGVAFHPVLTQNVTVRAAAGPVVLTPSESTWPTDPRFAPGRMAWGGGVSTDPGAREVVVPEPLFAKLGGTLTRRGPEPATLAVELRRKFDGRDETVTLALRVAGVARRPAEEKVFVPHPLAEFIDLWTSGKASGEPGADGRAPLPPVRYRELLAFGPAAHAARVAAEAAPYQLTVAPVGTLAVPPPGDVWAVVRAPDRAPDAARLAAVFAAGPEGTVHPVRLSRRPGRGGEMTVVELPPEDPRWATTAARRAPPLGTLLPAAEVPGLGPLGDAAGTPDTVALLDFDPARVPDLVEDRVVVLTTDAAVGRELAGLPGAVTAADPPDGWAALVAPADPHRLLATARSRFGSSAGRLVGRNAPAGLLPFGLTLRTGYYADDDWVRATRAAGVERLSDLPPGAVQQFVGVVVRGEWGEVQRFAAASRAVEEFSSPDPWSVAAVLPGSAYDAVQRVAAGRRRTAVRRVATVAAKVQVGNQVIAARVAPDPGLSAGRGVAPRGAAGGAAEVGAAKLAVELAAGVDGDPGLVRVDPEAFRLAAFHAARAAGAIPPAGVEEVTVRVPGGIYPRAREWFARDGLTLAAVGGEPAAAEWTVYRLTPAGPDHPGVASAVPAALALSRPALEAALPDLRQTARVGSADLTLVGTSPDDPRRAAAGMVRGRWPGAGPTDLVLPVEVARRLDPTRPPAGWVGMAVEVRFRRESTHATREPDLTLTLTVVGLADGGDAYAPAGLIDQLRLWQDDRVVYNAARRRFETPAEIYARAGHARAVAYAATVDEVEPLAQALDAAGYRVTHRLDTVRGLQQLGRVLAFVVAVFQVGFVGLAFLTVWGTTTLSIQARRWQIALYRSLGLTRWDVVSLFGLQGALLGLAGFAAGFAVAAAAEPVLTHAARSAFQLPAGVLARPLATAVPWWLVGGGLLMAVGVSVAAAVFPARSAAGVPPAELLKQEA